MTTYLLIIGVATLIFTIRAEPIAFKNCYTNGTVTSVDVSPCAVQPCVFHKGTNATVKICFTAPDSSVNATAEIDGIVGGIPVKFPMPNPDGCHQSGIQCPVTKGQTLCYTNALQVLPSYPEIRLVVRWKLTGDQGVPIFCVLFPVEIDGVRNNPKHHSLQHQPLRHQPRLHHPLQYQRRQQRWRENPVLAIFSHDV